MDQIKFFRRRQFLLGPEHIEFDGWKRTKIEDNYLLTVHPDLPVTIVEQQENKGVLLGYAIDPYQPDLTEEGILQRFVMGNISIAEVISGLEKLSGRFVLIVKSNEDLWLFHDAVALRQVQYCRDEHGAIWCASQAETLAELLGLDYDDEVLSYRNMSAYLASKDEFWLLNDRTPYRGIRNLLPNHYLDLRQANSFRFWPSAGCIPSLSVDQSIKLCTPILINSIKAAAERFDLRMGISAGSDSRKTLAASKDVKDKIYYFTHTPTQQSMLVNDVEIPARLLPKLALEHHSLGRQLMSNEFKKYYESSATWARESRGHISYTLLNYFGTEATVLNSNISEVAQCIYWLPKSKINGEGLAVISGLNHPFAIEEFQKWVDGARVACEQAKMNILDLFFLEQRMGRWAMAAFSEYDITHETFNPYNNRHLHCLMLAINERHRKNRRWDVTIKHIKYMWPEVLIEPINPPDLIHHKVQQFLRRFIIHKTISPWFPLYEYLRYLKLKRRFGQQIHQ
ncbi:MAG TPA: hypothetical protein VJ184_01145 [Chryseolinea sp.]|nr:hypothetical protein [Chryseolinea sp.]